MVVAPPSKVYTVSTVFFHKGGGVNVAVKYLISHFSMFVPTKATMRLDNINTGHSKGIGIILCCFPTVPLYIQWDQFIILQVTLKKLSNHFTSRHLSVISMS